MPSFVPLVSLLTLLGGQAEATAAPNGNTIEGCYLVAFQLVPVSSREAGMIASIDVKEGDDVTEDQLVGKIDDTQVVKAAEVAKYQYLSKKLEADNELTVKAYALAEGVAKAEWEAAVSANEKTPGSFSVFELRRLELTYQQRGIQEDVEAFTLEVKKSDARAAYAQYQQAQDMVKRHELRAPHAGRVERVEKYKGAWVSPGTPVIQLTRMDRLRVEGRISQRRFHPSDIDRRRADVQVFLAGGEDDRSVTISNVEIIASYVIEEDGSFRILAEFDNQKQGSKWLLNPGLSARIVLR